LLSRKSKIAGLE